MTIEIHRYTLRPLSGLNARSAGGAREGALLRVGGGYADVHPWPELGDAPLDEQLALLARGKTTRLTASSLALARVDGAARREGRSLFDGLTIPLSHWSGLDAPAGFDTVKIKGGLDFDPQSIPPGKRIRLDFNETLSMPKLLSMSLPVDRLEFVEDPFPYDRREWQLLRGQGFRLAIDRKVETEAVDVVIVKPALSVELPAVSLELVVTSYMDHPVGQFGVAWVAASNADRISDRCGLFTHVLFEVNEFSEAIRSEGSRLLPPAGTGIGFDDLLARLKWERLH